VGVQDNGFDPEHEVRCLASTFHYRRYIPLTLARVRTPTCVRQYDNCFVGSDGPGLHKGE
jgi:hypothetical protein